MQETCLKVGGLLLEQATHDGLHLLCKGTFLRGTGAVDPNTCRIGDSPCPFLRKRTTKDCQNNSLVVLHRKERRRGTNKHNFRHFRQILEWGARNNQQNVPVHKTAPSVEWLGQLMGHELGIAMGLLMEFFF